MNRRKLLKIFPPVSLAGCLRLAEEDGEEPVDELSENIDDAGEHDDSDDGSEDEEDGSEDEEDGNTHDDAEDDEPEYPRGVSDDGLSPILATVHDRELSERPYTAILTRENFNTGWRVEMEAISDGERLIMDSTVGDRTRSSFFDGSAVWWEERTTSGPTYGYLDAETNIKPYRLRRDRPTFANELEAFIVGGSYGAPVLEEDEPPLFTVESEAVDDVDAIPYVYADSESRAEDLEATFEIDTDGVIRSLEGGCYAVTDDGDEHLLTVDCSVFDLDETTVSEPDWVSTAVDQAPRFDVSLADDGAYVSIAHVDGDGTPPGTNAALRSPDDGEFWTRIDESVDDGETLFLWIEHDELAWSTEEPSTSERSISANWWVTYDFEGASYLEKQLYES